MNSHVSLLDFGLASTQLIEKRTSLLLNLVSATELTITPLVLSFCVIASFIGGAGISTCYPSATTIVLTLGPDLPWADEPSPGNLGLSTATFLAWLSLLIPALSLLYSPQLLSVLLQSVHNAPLPRTCVHPPLRCYALAPLHFRRLTTRPVSYYALFKCVAASEPTSWLSVQSNILHHLAYTLGP